MLRTAQNRNLNRAREVSDDEFYTQLHDIENEARHYKPHFVGKTVLCNCDDPWVSNFFDYFARNFEFLKLKKLVTTCYKSQRPDIFSRHDSEKAIYLEYAGDINNNRVPEPDEIGIKHLQGDGDFRNSECVALMRQADVVATNPPFSLFREYVAQLVSHEKKFLIVGNFNAVTYKEVFHLIKDNKIWVGVSPRGMEFKRPDGTLNPVNACWYTNMDYAKRHENLVLHKTYNADEYPTYDNYDAINVDKTTNIPADYDGVMGVPISFLDKYNPDQFKIVGMGEDNGRGFSGGVWKGGSLKCLIKGKAKFKRLFIKRKQAQP